MNVGEIYKTNNYGLLKITKYNSFKDITVKFLLTGYITKAQGGHINKGTVKDKTMPIAYGVGYIGNGTYCSRVNRESYDSWRSMLRRCYCKEFLSENKTYIGVTVCEDWYNFQVFSEWYYKNKPNDGLPYDLDKDIKSTIVKIYSPDTCLFVSRQANNEEALAKSYSLLSPEGKPVRVFNMSKFCRENNINRSGMAEMVRGKNKTCKGWKLNEN